MDPNNQNMNPGIPPRPASSGVGFIVATLILLAVILVAAVFFWQARGSQGDAALDQIRTQSDSDAAAAIEADLNATDVDSVDYDLTESNFTSS